MYLVCNNSGEYFTSGNGYFILDYIEDVGFLVTDNQNMPHYLSKEFAEKNFTSTEPN